MEAALDLLRLLYRGHEAVLISCHILTTKNEEKLSHLYSIPSNLILYNYILASKFAPTASIRTIWLRCNGHRWRKIYEGFKSSAEAFIGFYRD